MAGGVGEVPAHRGIPLLLPTRPAGVLGRVCQVMLPAACLFGVLVLSCLFCLLLEGGRK